VKRYFAEKGTEAADTIYEAAEAQNLTISFSRWNIGEVIGVFDRYLRMKIISEEEFHRTLNNFFAETIKLVRLGNLTVIPLTANILS